MSLLVQPLTNLAKRQLRRVFEIGQRFGIDILPRHFYSEIPDIRILKSTTPWRAARSMRGIRGSIEEQASWTDECTNAYRAKLKNFEIHKNALRVNGSSEGYGEVEADFLYCFLRAKRPLEIVQVGCGVSTAVCLQAAIDEGYTPRITCIEPYPTDFLKRESEAGRIDLVAKKIEDASTECIELLKSCDLFFVDSSHTLGPAGEVNLVILELLPRLTAGTFVHFHDIFFPYDYDPSTLSTALFFQHETALLYAFLVENSRFEIAASLSMLHHTRLDLMLQYFPDMGPQQFDGGLCRNPGQFPTSICLRGTAD